MSGQLDVFSHHIFKKNNNPQTYKTFRYDTLHVLIVNYSPQSL